MEQGPSSAWLVTVKRGQGSIAARSPLTVLQYPDVSMTHLNLARLAC